MTALAELLEAIPAKVVGPADMSIHGVVHDSRAVHPGDLFVALRGTRDHGSRYLSEAIRSGAPAVVLDEAIQVSGATAVYVPSTLSTLSRLAARFHRFPSRDLWVVGITGTNGKTTVSYLLASILEAAGRPTGVLGTVSYRLGAEVREATNTTPLADELQALLRQMADRTLTSCVMEVSSHALALERVEDVEFDVGIVTNITRDHLDFHHTIEAYAAAKARLLTLLARSGAKTTPKRAILNRDDPWTPFMERHAQCEVVSFGAHPASHIRWDHVVAETTGTTFVLTTPIGRTTVHLALLGRHNVANAAAATAAALGAGITLPTIVRGLEQLRSVPGRLERIEAGQAFTVLVDYAHTDDALLHALETIRLLTPRRIITVFGCGGDRDRTKRPLMGMVVGRLSDLAIITSDNPRGEDPEAIAREVEAGLQQAHGASYRMLLDREEAIRAAVQAAQGQDVLLIAGKGHETTQILKDRSIPFDDRAVARACIAELLRTSSTI